jgi:hypothetical protein
MNEQAPSKELVATLNEIAVRALAVGPKDHNITLDEIRAISKAADLLATHEPPADQPVAWIIPGDDNARADGSIDARISEEGEFTKPLYAQPYYLDGLSIHQWREHAKNGWKMYEQRAGQPPEALRAVVQAVVDWNTKYPSSRIYGEGSIRRIAAEMDVIFDQAKKALAGATPPPFLDELKLLLEHGKECHEKWNLRGAIIDALMLIEKHTPTKGENHG